MATATSPVAVRSGPATPSPTRGLEECVPPCADCPTTATPGRGPGAGRVGGRRGVPRLPLTRRIRERENAVVADYTLAAEPGYRFVWAAHACCSLRGPLDRRCRTRGDPALPGRGDRWIAGVWPTADGVPLDRLGPTTGAPSEPSCSPPGWPCTTAPIRCLLSVEADGQPVAVALWRNLGGFPRTRPTVRSASSRCSAASSTVPRPTTETPPSYRRPVRSPGGSTVTATRRP